MSIAPNTPVIIGVAQRTDHEGTAPLEPLDAWAEVCAMAAEDAGLPRAELRNTQFLAVADCLSWIYDDQVGRLAERLGATPRGRYRSAASGTAGQSMMSRAVNAIRSGDADFAILCGGEAMASRGRYLRDGISPPWSHPAPPGTLPSFDLETQQHPGESASGMLDGYGAICSFAMRDVARRAHLGISPEDYRAQIGTTMAGLTRVAADNPDAWFRQARDPAFLIEPRPDNRWVTYPYTKHLVAMMAVDITAAIIVVSQAKADALGIPEEKRVYPWTTCYAADPADTAVRPFLWRSEAMAAASSAVLAAAGITQADIAHIDFYSCFPAAVNFARDAVGVGDRPGERLTVTGGLPYAGGPASSYMMTSLVKMAQRLRTDPGSIGLVSGVGMMMSNHSFGLYSTRPPEDVAPIDEAGIQAELDRQPRVPVRSDHDGRATIATYTIMYDRDGQPSHGAAVCDLPGGARGYARMFDPELLAAAHAEEMVGREVLFLAGEHAGEIRLARG